MYNLNKSNYVLALRTPNNFPTLQLVPYISVVVHKPPFRRIPYSYKHNRVFSKYGLLGSLLCIQARLSPHLFSSTDSLHL